MFLSALVKLRTKNVLDGYKNVSVLFEIKTNTENLEFTKLKAQQKCFFWLKLKFQLL